VDCKPELRALLAKQQYGVATVMLRTRVDDDADGLVALITALWCLPERVRCAAVDPWPTDGTTARWSLQCSFDAHAAERDIADLLRVYSVRPDLHTSQPALRAGLGCTYVHIHIARATYLVTRWTLTRFRPPHALQTCPVCAPPVCTQPAELAEQAQMKAAIAAMTAEELRTEVADMVEAVRERAVQLSMYPLWMYGGKRAVPPAGFPVCGLPR
jgi:hypothetical protein